MEEPRQGKYGLWYADGVGFATRAEAEARLRNKQTPSLPHQKHSAAPPKKEPWQFAGYSMEHWVAALILCAIFIGVFMWLDQGEPADVEPRASADQIRECGELIKDRVSNPSTLDIHWISGTVSDMKGTGGTARVRINFDASNAFGVESHYRALCRFAPGEPRIVIFERK